MFVARKVGFAARPPQLVVDYAVASTGKVRRRCIPVQGLAADTNIERDVLPDIAARHDKYLARIPKAQVCAMAIMFVIVCRFCLMRGLDGGNFKLAWQFVNKTNKIHLS